jgi:hypothetical protein
MAVAMQIGDWGRQGISPQKKVAKMMANVADCMPPAFIISTGDNFYTRELTPEVQPGDAKGVSSKQWEQGSSGVVQGMDDCGCTQEACGKAGAHANGMHADSRTSAHILPQLHACKRRRALASLGGLGNAACIRIPMLCSCNEQPPHNAQS